MFSLGNKTSNGAGGTPSNESEAKGTISSSKPAAAPASASPPASTSASTPAQATAKSTTQSNTSSSNTGASSNAPSSSTSSSVPPPVQSTTESKTASSTPSNLNNKVESSTSNSVNTASTSSAAPATSAPVAAAPSPSPAPAPTPSQSTTGSGSNTTTTNNSSSTNSNPSSSSSSAAGASASASASSSSSSSSTSTTNDATPAAAPKPPTKGLNASAAEWKPSFSMTPPPNVQNKPLTMVGGAQTINSPVASPMSSNMNVSPGNYANVGQGNNKLKGGPNPNAPVFEPKVTHVGAPPYMQMQGPIPPQAGYYSPHNVGPMVPMGQVPVPYGTMPYGAIPAYVNVMNPGMPAGPMGMPPNPNNNPYVGQQHPHSHPAPTLQRPPRPPRDYSNIPLSAGSTAPSTPSPAPATAPAANSNPSATANASTPLPSANPNPNSTSEPKPTESNAQNVTQTSESGSKASKEGQSSSDASSPSPSSPEKEKSEVEAKKESNGGGDSWRRKPLQVETEAVEGSKSAPTSATSTGSSGWRRGESIKTRYDKLALLALFVKGKTPPEDLLSQYPEHARTERIPKGLKLVSGRARGGREDDTPHPDEGIIFAPENLNKEGVFKYDEKRLADETDPEVIVRKANLILNKLSVTKFEKLSDDFMSVGLDTPELMERAVEMIVLKAQMEEHFCFMYADLCRKITDRWGESVPGDGKEQEEELGKAFRVRLLERCQEEFEVDRVKALEEIRASDLPQEEKDEKEIILKKRFMGHMRFVGEIFMKDLVSPKIMYSCIDMLMESTDEETLVCMVKLLETIGSKLEAYDQRKKKGKFTAYFEKVTELSESHPSSRMRFMLRDLIEMRSNGWQQRRVLDKAVSLEEIRGEQQDGKSSPRAGGGGGGGWPQSGGGSAASSPRGRSQDVRGFTSTNTHPPSDEWQTVASTKKRGAAPTSGSAVSRNDAAPSKVQTTPKGGGFSALAGTAKRKDDKEKGAKSDKDKNAGKSSSSNSNNKDLVRSSSLQSSSSSSSALSSLSEEDKDKGKGGNDKSSGATLPGADGTLDKETVTRIRGCVNEYLVHNLVPDTLLDLRDMVDPRGMGDVLSTAVKVVMDKKESDRDALVTLVIAAHADGLMSTSEINRGFDSLLNELDDLLIDVPKASLYISRLLVRLSVEGIVSLGLLTPASLSPDNAFIESTRAADFICSCVHELALLKGDDEAVTAIQATGINVYSLLKPFGRQTVDDMFKDLVTKYSLPKAFVDVCTPNSST